MRSDLVPRSWPKPAPPADRRPASYGEPVEGSLNLSALGRLLVRRARMILATILLLTMAAAAVIFSLSPQYGAEALILVGERPPTLLDIQNAVQGQNTETADSDIEILRSRHIAKIVVEQLHLDREPSINPELRPKSWISDLSKRILGRVQAWMGRSDSNADVPTRASQQEIAVSRTADELIRHLVVAAKGRSRVVGVSFEADSPELAAAVANAVADAYVADQLKAKVQSSDQAKKWLSDWVEKLREQVVATDRAVHDRKVAAGIIDGRQVGLTNEQISELSDQVVQAHADTLRAEAKLSEIKRAGPSADVEDVVMSPEIQRLREERADIQRRLESARQTLGDLNPTITRLIGERDGLDRALSGEIVKIKGAVENSAAATRMREAALRRSLAELKEQVANQGAADVQILALQREAEATHALYDRVLSRAKEASVETGLQRADAEIVARADVPERPAFPNRPLFMTAAFIAAIATAALLVFAVESLDHGLSDLSDVERLLGIPALGYLPKLRGRPDRWMAAAHIVEKPHSEYAEAVRGLHTSLMLSDVEHAPKVVLVTSALPGEGKTSLALSLARLMAATGKKVVLIDCDLRRCSATEVAGIPQEPGLVDYLLGTVTVAEAICRDGLSGAHLLPAGSRALNPPDVLGSDNMARLLSLLAAAYDLIIMDSAPLLAVSDTRRLCRLADKVVLAVQWQRTRTTAAVPAARLIAASGGDIAGALLTLVDVRRLASHTGNAYYVRQLSKYLPQ
jgi:polysaccharide biosynthesis transport protein